MTTDETPENAAQTQLQRAMDELDKQENGTLDAILENAERYVIHPSRVITILAEALLNFAFNDSDKGPYNIITVGEREYEWWEGSQGLLRILPGTAQLRVCIVLLLAAAYRDLLADRAEAYDKAANVEGSKLN